MFKLNAVIIQFHFKCARMTMNNISSSGGLTVTLYECSLYLEKINLRD